MLERAGAPFGAAALSPLPLFDELETSTYEKKDRDGNVIDSNGLGMRVRANAVEGPFRVMEGACGSRLSADGLL